MSSLWICSASPTYVQSIPAKDFERFLGETSRSLQEQLADPEIIAVFKRLKDR